jgi:3-dehydroquinate synthase
LGSDAVEIPDGAIRVSVGERSYVAFIGERLLEQIGEQCRRADLVGPCAIISDENVASLFADRVKESLAFASFKPTLITVPAGEKSKSLEQAGAICDRMIGAGLDRTSFVVALGGGMIGDLAGFVAAIFHRGIPWINVPTTLLAQVDSCIGGKTGVNTPAGKNLIGAVNQPALVIADIETLKTLPAREFNQGFAEIIKHAIIRDAALFKKVAQASSWKLALPDLVSLVRRNIEIKAEFVAADERDTHGKRALLNFGHTVGHAIEYAAGYRDLLHGEAVSLGIVAACDISVRKAGLSETQRAEIVSMLQAFDLPTRLPANFSREKIMEALPRDKKFQGGRVRFVVTPAIGSARVATDVTMDDIREAVAKL